MMLSLFCFKLFYIFYCPVAEKGLDEYEVGVDSTNEPLLIA